MRIRISLILMILTILLVTLGQSYWLLRLYQDECTNLQKGIDAQFRNSFYQLQRTRFLQDSLLFAELADTLYAEKEKIQPKRTAAKKSNQKILLTLNGAYFTDSNAVHVLDSIKPENIASIRIVSPKEQLGFPPELMETLIIKSKKLANDRIVDSINKPINLKTKGINITLVRDTHFTKRPIIMKMPVDNKKNIRKSGRMSFRKTPIIRMITDNKTLNDSVPIASIKKYFQKNIPINQQSLPYQVVRQQWEWHRLPKLDETKDTLKGFITSAQFSGIKSPYSYQLLYPDIRKFIYQQMKVQIAGAVLMIVILITAFVFIYHTLHRQKRLADIRNEFLNNITHELKTPIATVHVALEALQNFNAMDDAKKSKEYLNISVSELNRLELLVDHVLKRSMLEKDAAQIEPTKIHFQQLIESVLLTLKVRFEKSGACVNIHAVSRDIIIEGDQLHLTSVLYNLLDNAIKYSEGKPEIDITIEQKNDRIIIAIADKGIGIPKAYQDKIFQPFFRVPHMDHHNTKGYGLGLSYVAQIIKLHKGTISVSDRAHKGTVFTIQLPMVCV